MSAKSFINNSILDESVPEGGWSVKIHNHPWPVISPTHPPVHPNISSTWWLFMNYTRKQSRWYSKFDILSKKWNIEFK